MPPYYPDQYENQYPNSYPYGAPYNDSYNQYQYTSSPQSQQIPPYSQIQINVPPRPPQQHSAQLQQQFNYNPNFQPTYAQPTAQFQYQNQHQHQHQHQYQPQPQQSYAQQYHQPQPQPQPQRPPQPPQMQQQNGYSQSIPQYRPSPQQIQVNIPKPQPQPQPPQRVLKDVQPTAPRQQQQPAAPRPQQPKKQSEPTEPDYDILLLSFADEYLEAAQNLSVRSEEYFELTSTALGCIDVVLNNFKLPPLREAQTSLRYAQLLFSETENYDDAERILTKTIDLCERLKYHDLKYGAQLLLTRVLYQSRPRAALKDLQGMIQDIEAYRHIAWEYAFRFQYVMFLVSSSQPSDNHTAIAQLERICHVARQYGDHAVLAFAAVLEAHVHLQTTSPESVNSSQRSLAKARALQLNPDIEENPQICIMMEFVDLCGQIKISDNAQGEVKRKTMQSVLYPALQKPSWWKDGLMYLPINRASLRGLQVQDGGLIADRGGKHYLTFSWLPKDEIEDLGYLLSGISAAYKNSGDGGKAEKFLVEGLKMIKELLNEKQPMSIIGDSVRVRQQLVQCHFLLELTLLQCSKGLWRKAQTRIEAIDDVAQDLGVKFPAEMNCLVDYLRGAIHQGSGDLEAALNIFQSPTLSITSQLDNQGLARPASQLQKGEEVIRNISILAAMNTIFIIGQPLHPQHSRLSSLINGVDSLVKGCTNTNISAAWNFVLASLPNNTILKTKQYLGNALTAAQSISNAQITTLCLVTMQEKFFKGVVGEQAVKCARAASHQAKRLNEPMWIAAASGLEAECMGLQGKFEESMRKWEDSEKAMSVLPEKVKNQIMF